jgi:hypothetical protein
VLSARHLPLVMALGVGALACAGDDLPSFDRVRQQYQESNDLTRVSHLYRRCAALQLNVAALLARKKQIKASQDYENQAHHYMLLSESVDVEVDQKRGVPSGKTMETVNLAVKYLTEQYDQRMKANFAKRGEYFVGDGQLETELAQCLKPEALVKRSPK